MVFILPINHLNSASVRSYFAISLIGKTCITGKKLETLW